MLNYIMLAEATHPWALGVFVFILGVSGLFLLARSGWENEKDSQSWRSQLFEAGIIICGLLVVVPILMLVPEETRKVVYEDETSYIAPFRGGIGFVSACVWWRYLVIYAPGASSFPSVSYRQPSQATPGSPQSPRQRPPQ